MPIFISVDFAFRNIISYNDDIIWKNNSPLLACLLQLIVDGRLSYQSSYGFASGQIPRRSQGTLLPSSGEPKVSNPWNNVQRKDSI
jgi:hypothetical protein